MPSTYVTIDLKNCHKKVYVGKRIRLQIVRWMMIFVYFAHYYLLLSTLVPYAKLCTTSTIKTQIHTHLLFLFLSWFEFQGMYIVLKFSAVLLNHPNMLFVLSHFSMQNEYKIKVSSHCNIWNKELIKQKSEKIAHFEL